jgi:hypothetical protein
MSYQKLSEDELNLDEIDVEDLLKEHTTMTVDKTFKKFECKEISIGNGQYYYIDDRSSNIEKNKLAYNHMKTLIQIFIELRNALGYTSKPPHLFGPIELAEVIKTLQIEYAKVYGILFSYGYQILKADPLIPQNNFRPLNTLTGERIKASNEDTVISAPLTIRLPSPPPITSTHELPPPYESIQSTGKNINDGGDDTGLNLSYLNKRRFGMGCLANNYTPLPQRPQRERKRFASEDALPVTSAPRIYGNQQIRKRKGKCRIPIIHEPEY